MNRIRPILRSGALGARRRLRLWSADRSSGAKDGARADGRAREFRRKITLGQPSLACGMPAEQMEKEGISDLAAASLKKLLVGKTGHSIDAYTACCSAFIGKKEDSSGAARRPREAAYPGDESQRQRRRAADVSGFQKHRPGETSRAFVAGVLPLPGNATRHRPSRCR